MLGSDRIIGLDIGASTVKIGEFQVTKGHGLRLINFNHADLGIDPEHEENRTPLIVSTIRNMIAEQKIKARRVVFSISGQAVFTRFVKLPPVEESKVAQIIQYEAQQNVPFPIEEVVWDYQLLGATPQGELEVVLLAIKSDLVEELNSAIEDAGLSTEMVDAAPMALYNAVRYNYGDLDGCTVLLDIGARTTNLLFLDEGRIFTRSIPIAGNAITQSIATEFNVPFANAEQMKKSKGFVALGGAYEEPPDEVAARISKVARHVMTRLHAEVARSINFYKNQQGGRAPKRVLLSGGASVLPYMNRFFEEKLQVPIEFFNPFRNVAVADHVSREELSKCAHFMGEVVGLGLRQISGCPIEVNLLPKSLRSRKQMESKQPYFIGAAACLMLVPLCFLIYTKQTIKLNQRDLKTVSDQVENLDRYHRDIQREQSQLNEVKSKADQIVGVIGTRTIWVSLLNDLNGRIVPDMWVTGIAPISEDTTQTTTTPASTGRGGRVRSSLEEPPSVSETGEARPKTFHTLEIRGAGVHSFDNPRQDLDLVDRFAKNLRESPLLDPNGVEIVVPPNPMSREPEFTFVIQVKLKNALPF